MTLRDINIITKEIHIQVAINKYENEDFLKLVKHLQRLLFNFRMEVMNSIRCN